MKYFFYVLSQLAILLTISSPALCQHTEPLMLKVTYTFIYLYDTTNNTPASETEVILRIGKTNSKFNNAKLESPQHLPVKQSAISPNVNMNIKTVVGSPMVVVTSKEMNKEIY